MKVFFSVGEPSGDLHGANLVRALKEHYPEIECVGYGGPKMASAGCKLHFDLTKLAVMWFLRVLLNYRTFKGLIKSAEKWFRENRPDAVVLIDYPGFNWHIAKAAKRSGIPVVYYGVPQLWAWGGWRIKKLKRDVDHVLCKLPFEANWYAERGCKAVFVGHPYFDELAAQQPDEQLIEQLSAGPERLVGILPGSRTQEVLANLPWFLRAAGHVARQTPFVRFAVASFNESQAELARQMVQKERRQLPENTQIEVYVGKTAEILAAAHSCLACSGSVSLELLYHQKPSVILYYISRAAMKVQSWFRRARYITLVNLLAADNRFMDQYDHYDPDAPDAEPVPFPEYLTCGDRARDMAAHVVKWLNDAVSYEEKRRELHTLLAQIGKTGASNRAAQYLIEEVLPHPARVVRHAA
jgi:lipid-A-disaccharide synthase